MRVFSVLLVLVFCSVSGDAFAQADAAERTRLLAAYEATHDVSTGCTLGEIERRLGLLEDAARHLDAAIEVARVSPGTNETATLSACRFNRARVYEDAGDPRRAYRLLARALETPNVERRRTIERRLVTVAARLVAAEGCAALTSRYSAHALLRFSEEPTLRGCVEASRRTYPLCTRIAARDLPSEDDLYGARRPDPNTIVGLDQGLLEILMRRGARTTGLSCRLPNDDERLQDARWLMLRGARLLEVSTQTTVSYACDCEEGDDSGDCRCSDVSGTRYLLSERGELVLALIVPWADRDGMASWGQYADELQDADEAATTVDGDVLVVNGRRVRLVRGVLVPAPPAR